MIAILKISSNVPRLGIIPRLPAFGPQLVPVPWKAFHHSAVNGQDHAAPERLNQKLRIMFFGTDQFAVESLSKIHEEFRSSSGCVSRLEVTCLNMKSLVPAVSRFAEEHNLNLHLWPPDTEHIKRNFDLGVVASFGKLIPNRIIESFPKEMINVHGSLLPRWRGAAPVVHAIRNGDTKTGVTIMKVKPRKFDVGEMLARAETEIEENITRPELTQRLGQLGADLLVTVLKDFDKINREAVKQDESEMTLAPLIDKNIAVIKWTSMSKDQVYNLWRAVGDLTKLRTVYQETGHPVMIATVLSPRELEGADLDPHSEPGTLTFIRRGKKRRYVCVKCREGWVAVSDIYYHNKKVMGPMDFYNGWLSKTGSHKFI